jgi:hypothetical protein
MAYMAKKRTFHLTFQPLEAARYWNSGKVVRDEECQYASGIGSAGFQTSFARAELRRCRINASGTRRHELRVPMQHHLGRCLAHD